MWQQNIWISILEGALVGRWMAAIRSSKTIDFMLTNNFVQLAIAEDGDQGWWLRKNYSQALTDIRLNVFSIFVSKVFALRERQLKTIYYPDDDEGMAKGHILSKEVPATCQTEWESTLKRSTVSEVFSKTELMLSLMESL